eukprot:TRINITY_DN2089_c0_g1_i7.p1 TRINITY_DN2089_c0_g1~~TRINITY_DN2089_c0_g1_i7.p1  ORF type:complete len:928 (-),score=164.55 TRINITY_DN2089_c0_g1_i7:556-3339(-)
MPWLLLLLLPGTVLGTTFTPVTSSSSCTSGSYLDTATFSCVACDATTQDVTPDGYGCQCKAGYIRDFNTTSTTAPNPPCIACTYASDSLRLFCMTCDSTTTGFDTSTRECTCATGGLVETDQAGVTRTYKSCVTCTAGSYLSGGVCLPCNDPLMQASTSTCACNSSYTQVNGATYNDGVCLHTATTTDMQTNYPASTAYTVTYPNVVSAAGTTTSSVTSAVLERWFYEAAVKCTREAGVQWCQMLANMCVLQMYLESSAACAAWISLTAALTTNGFTGWGTGIGFLYFANTGFLDDIDGITTSYSFERTDVPYTDTLDMRLASYAFNGTFLGWHNLTTQLNLCGGEYDRVTKWTGYGHWQLIECDLDINRFVRANDTVFYDPYFVNTDGTLYPMPVIIANYRDSSNSEPMAEYDEYFFQKSYGASARLMRRFFLWDNLSGRVGSTTNSPTVVRMLNTAGILVKTQTQDPNSITPPRLVLSYSEIDITDLANSTVYNIQSQFGSAYSMTVGDGSFGDGYSFWFPIVLVSGLVLLGIRGYRWSKANRPAQATCRELRIGLGLLFRTVSHIFGLGYIGFAWYWYAVFKWPNAIVTLMPSDPEISQDLLLYYVVTWGGVFVGTLMMLWRQTKTDFLLIDWEDPHGRVYDEHKHAIQAPVSTWRKLFVANEFARLQIVRLVDYNLTCVLVLAFLGGVPSFEEPYYNASCNTPSGNDLHLCNPWARSTLMRIAVDSFFWVTVTLVQVLWTKLVVQRYYKHPSSQILDVLSLANVSAWILPDKFAGYYLHGQSSLQHADTALCEFSQLLSDEEENITSRRGLLPDSDLQEFLMFMSTSSREKIDNFLEEVRALQKAQEDSMSWFEGIKEQFRNRRDHRMIQPGSASLVDASKAVNQVLRRFIKQMQTVAHCGINARMVAILFCHDCCRCTRRPR